MTYAIQVERLAKRFGSTVALTDVSFAARAGTLLALLGRNGAGKTTAVRILTTLVQPDSGNARICGHDVVRDAHRVRQLISATGQYVSVDEGLSGRNNLIMLGRLLGFPRAVAGARARELLMRFELSDVAGRPAKTYSGGMRRRLDLAASLVGRPRVIFLDEPTTGLDPHSRAGMWRVIRELLDDGVTVLLTTQYLEEADQLAHAVALIDRGRVIATGTPDELKAKTGGQVLDISPADASRLTEIAVLLETWTGAAAEISPEQPRVTASVSDTSVLADIVRRLDESGIALNEFALRRASLEEVFLTLTGRQAPHYGYGPTGGHGASAGTANRDATEGTVLNGRHSVKMEGPTPSRSRSTGLGRSKSGPPVTTRRVGLADGLSHTSTLTFRSMLRLRTNIEDIIALSLQPIMFLLLLTYVFGGAIAGSAHQYLQYLLPGLLVMTAVFATIGTGLMLNQDISTGVFDRFRTLPIARWAPLAGAIVGDLARYAISMAVTLAFALVLGFRIRTNPLAAALAFLLVLGFALAMCWVSALIGMLVRSPQGVQAFELIVIFPLVFGSNIMVMSSTMPGWLQDWVNINPITLLTSAARGLLTGGPVSSPAWQSGLWALGLLAVFVPLSVEVYRRRSGSA
jgi:oleandomycin transport system ATP-binding protein